MPSENTKKYRVAAVGPRELLSGLESLGVVVYHATTTKSAQEKMEIIIQETVSDKDPFAIMLVVENLLQGLSEDAYQKISKNPLPALLSIPDLNSSDDTGLAKLRDMTTRAIGSDIFSS
jgi:vacuolar-type H+-ATPase subunit F/Vma7